MGSDRMPAKSVACQLALALSMSLSACSSAHYFVNEPLDADQEGKGYAVRHLASAGNSDSLLIVVAFSGGGYRAAALAQATLEVLASTTVSWEGHRTRLLDEVDFISAVSGGSLTAAYYALHRDGALRDFVPNVLDVDLQSAVSARLLSPSGLWRQSAARYGRGDLLQEVLDEKIFGGARFAEIERRRPLVFINATDLHFGDRFEFTQDQFDHLCSDLESFPVSRAVAASMAVPMLFSPITVWNHEKGCRAAVAKPALMSRVQHSPFVHLMDGGLADNTGVRAPLEIIQARGGIVGSAKAAGFQGVRKRVFIVVNAQLSPRRPEHQSADTPGLLQQLRSVVDVPIDRYSEGSIALLREATAQWRKSLSEASVEDLGGRVSRDTEFHVIELSLTRAADDPEARVLAEVGTALRMTPTQWRAIQSFTRRCLQQDSQWQLLMSQLDGHTDFESSAAEDAPTP